MKKLNLLLVLSLISSSKLLAGTGGANDGFLVILILASGTLAIIAILNGIDYLRRNWFRIIQKVKTFVVKTLSFKNREEHLFESQ
jgi:Kef-type K+ transport system membrane component KefB